MASLGSQAMVMGCLSCFPNPVLSRRIMALLSQEEQKTDVEISHLFYTYDLVDQCTVCSSTSIAALLGYSESAIAKLGSNSLASLIHPDDMCLVADHYQRFTSLQPGEFIQVEYRMRHAIGQWCRLRSEETPLSLSSQGFPLQVLGLVQNLTPITLAKNALLSLQSFLPCHPQDDRWTTSSLFGTQELQPTI